MAHERSSGTYYTPDHRAKQFADMLNERLGPGWEDHYWVYDPCAGRGALCRHLPRPDRLFMSTLVDEDVEVLKVDPQFARSTVFQYDYLNDDVDLLFGGTGDWKMPYELRSIMSGTPERLLVIMNPPYVGRTTKGCTEAPMGRGVLCDRIRPQYGRALHDVAGVFVVRAHMQGCGGLGLVTKMSLYNAESMARLRDLPYRLDGGFIGSSQEFEGTKGKFPVSYTLMKPGEPCWSGCLDTDSGVETYTAPPDFQTDEPHFYDDCTVFALFHGSNQTSSLKDVEYKGEIYQVRNQFFPFDPALFIDLAVDERWAAQLAQASPTFVEQQLYAEHSPEAQAVLDAGFEVYMLFYLNLDKLDHERWKLYYWDAGWYQIRNALKAAGLATDELERVAAAVEVLREKIEHHAYALGFIRA